MIKRKYTFVFDDNRINPDLIYKHGVGGTQLAFFKIIEAINKFGHEIEVFGQINFYNHNNIIYRNINDFNYSSKFDVVIIFRANFENISKIDANAIYYFSIDPTFKLNKKNLDCLRIIFCISKYHKEIFIKNENIDRNKIEVIDLGIDTNEYEKIIRKKKNRLIYCSMPDRGLKYLVDIFPKIQNVISDVSLVVTSDLSLYGKKWKNNSDINNTLNKLKNYKNVTLLGRVSRKKLIKEQKTAELHIYPYSNFELFCISSIECQASGTPTITTNRHGLKTTVKNSFSGILINGHPKNKRVQDEFVKVTINLLKNRCSLYKLSSQSRERAFKYYNWNKIAIDFINITNR